MTQQTRSISFDRVADDYDRTRGGAERGAAAAVALLPLLPDADPVLEIGVGTGLVAAGLTAHGRLVAGVDLSLPMLRHAAGRLPGRVFAGDGLRLPVGSGAVGAVVFIHVLHLVGDLAGTLAEAARVLRPGGRVVASIGPDQDAPASDVAQILWKLARELRRDERRPDAYDTVLDAARRAGLSLVDRGAYQPGHIGHTPAEAIDRISIRSWSWMWQVDDEAWAGAAATALDALRRLPDQDRPRPDERELPLLAFAATG